MCRDIKWFFTRCILFLFLTLFANICCSLLVEASPVNISVTPVPPVIIELLSPPTIEGECLAPADGSDAVLNIRCRTIILGMYGGTFPATSLALTSVVLNRVLAPAYLADRLAFGIAQRWSEMSENIIIRTVTNNDGSLMFIELPNCASFDLSQDEVLNINTEIPDLVQSFITPSSGVISVTLEKQPPAEVNWRIVAFAYLSTVPAVLSAVQPFPSTITEMQFLLLFTRSTSCSFPYVRSLSSEMFRIVFPSVEGDNDADQLMHNVLISLFLFLFHVFLVVICKIMLKCPFRTACALLYFPSFFMSACHFLLPGIMFASTKLAVYGSSPGHIVAGIAGILYSFFITFGLTFIVRRWFVNVTLRSISAHLLDFPKVLQLLMPSRSWGPSPRVNAFLVPYAYIGSSEYLSHSFRPYAIAMVMGFVTGFEPYSPVGCAAQAGAITVLLVGIPAYEYRRNLYRCPAFGLMGSATMAFTALVSLTFFIHGVRPTAVTLAESPLTVMMVAVVFAVFLRSFATIGIALLEYLVVRPRVWPEAGFKNLKGSAAGFIREDETSDDASAASSSISNTSLDIGCHSTSSLTAARIAAAVGIEEQPITYLSPLDDQDVMGMEGDASLSAFDHSNKNRSMRLQIQDSFSAATRQAKAYAKGRMRALSKIIEAKADENERAMQDSDEETLANHLKPKSMSKRRAKLLQKRRVDPEYAEALRALLVEEEHSFDRIHSIESQRQFNNENGSDSLGNGRSAASFLATSNGPSSGRWSSNNNFTQLRHNTTAAASSMYSPPILGPIPQLDPAITRRTKALTGSEEGGGGMGTSGGKGVRFQLAGKGKPPPITHVLQGKGPMPPLMEERQRREYDML